MNTGMLGNYLSTALRILVRNPLYSGINILGLATGLACCILIFLFVRDELSYDRWIPDAERIYRSETTFIIPGREPIATAQTPGPAHGAFLKDFPDEIEAAVRLFEREPTVNLGDRQFNDTLIEADASFFQVFKLPFVTGDPGTALRDTQSLVLTETAARKYFGDENPVGRTLTLDRREPRDYQVTAVIRDIPENSHLAFSMLSLFDPEYYADDPWVADRWTSSNSFIYIKFASADAAARVAEQIDAFIDANVNFEIPAIQHITPSDVLEVSFQPLTRIHLYSSRRGGFKPGGDATTVYTFSAVAALILLIASINFMNLATARSLQRAREVSMRKVVGATRRQLIVQFLGESVLMTILALALAVILVNLALPWYNSYIGKELAFNPLTDLRPFLWTAVLAVGVGVLGGMYPAFFLSRFRPATVLKANQSAGLDGSSWMRSALVVVQFSISIGLIVTTLIIYGQTYYARNMDLGYNRDHMLAVSGTGREAIKHLQATFLEEVRKLPGVVSAGRATDQIPQDSSNNTLVELPDVHTEDLLVVEEMTVDDGFFPTLGVEPAAGRLFSRDFPGDVMPHDADEIEEEVTAGAVLNMSAVRRLGFGSAEEAVGKTFRTLVGEEKKALVTVIGVVNDMHMRSLHFEVTPMIFYYGNTVDHFYYTLIHLRADDLPATLRDIDALWQGLVPEVPIERSFVDEEFAKLYRSEEERMKIFAGFSAFAVFVACLGLFGLASFTVDRRTREIGIRKVLGASVFDIQRLMLWQFSRPVLLANIIAWPAAYWFLQSWLSTFQYRIDVTPVPFLAAGAAGLIIAWITVIAHATRVARSNPVNALRYE